MEQQSTRFEIRKGIPNHNRHNAILQAAYDTIDRMATLFGEMPFGELLSSPINAWIPSVLPKIDLAAEYGLIAEPDEVKVLFARLQKSHGGDSFQTIAAYMATEDARLSREFYSPVYKLWFYHGIRLPEFGRNPRRNETTHLAMEKLLDLAGDFTYTTWYTTARSKDLKAAILSVRAAAESFIIYLPPGNGLCCYCSSNCTCVPGLTTDFCQMLGGSCAAGSSSCGTDGPNQ